jgi:NADH-quinone oxidoreductase subunit J
VGQALFTHYLLLVEVAAMLLLAALVAAFHLGKREPGEEEQE